MISEEAQKREALKQFRQSAKLFVECLINNDHVGAAKHSRKLIDLKGAVGKGAPDTEAKLFELFQEGTWRALQH